MSSTAVTTDPTLSGPIPSGPPRTRRIAGALCLPAMFVALIATGPLDPFDDQATARVQLAALPGHVGEVRALGYVELLAALLSMGVVLAFAGLTRGRGRGLGNAGVLLGVLGSLGMTLVAVHHWVLAALGAVPPTEGGRVVDRLDSVAGPAILPMMLAMPVALLLFAIAGHRAGFVPVPALVLAVLFFVGEWVPALPGGELGPLVLGLVAFTWVAVTVLRQSPDPSYAPAEPSFA